MSNPASKRKDDGGEHGQPPAKKGKYNPLLKGKKKVVLLSREERKAQAKHRKAQKPHAEVVSQLNRVWSVSLTALKPEERSKKIDELLAASKGRIALVAARHDASRVFQNLVKHGSHRQRALVLDELAGRMGSLAADKYGHHVVLKLLQNAKKEARRRVVDELQASAQRLAFHLDGAKVLDYAYATAQQGQRDAVLRHFYGAEFALFGDGGAAGGKAEEEEASGEGGELIDRLLAAHPEKRASVLDSVERALQKAANKEMLMFRFVHTLARQFLERAAPAKARDVASLLHAHVVDLYHSEDGARALMHCLEQGTPKERKVLLKSLKEAVHGAASDPHGFMVVVRALDVVDDTVLLRKQVLQPLLDEDVLELADNINGSRVLLHLLAPRDLRYMHPSLVARLQPVPETSRKDPEQRRKELLDVSRAPVLECVAANAGRLVRSRVGCRVVVEALREAAAGGKPLDGEPRKAMKAVARSVVGGSGEEEGGGGARAKFVAFGGGGGSDDDDSNKDDDGKQGSKKKKDKKSEDLAVLEHPCAHYTIKRIVAALKEESEEASRYFNAQLVAAIEEAGDLADMVVVNRPAFVMEALLKAMDGDEREAFCKKLGRLTDEMKEAGTAGGKALAAEVEGKADGGVGAASSSSSGKRKDTEVRRSARKRARKEG